MLIEEITREVIDHSRHFRPAPVVPVVTRESYAFYPYTPPRVKTLDELKAEAVEEITRESLCGTATGGVALELDRLVREAIANLPARGE